MVVCETSDSPIVGESTLDAGTQQPGGVAGFQLQQLNHGPAARYLGMFGWVSCRGRYGLASHAWNTDL